MDKKNINKGDVAKATAGASSAAVGGALLLKALKTKKLTPKEEKEIIEGIVKSGKKPGEYLYQRAIKNQSLRRATKKAARNSAGSRGAGWFGSGEKIFSNNINNTMEIKRKVFSRLQDENGEERLYSTNEFELSYSEEGEKTFSAVNKGKEIIHTVGEKAGEGLVWIKTKAGEWVKVAEDSLKELGSKVADGTKKATDAVVSGTKKGAEKVAEGAKNVSGKVAAGAKAGAKWVAAHPYKAGAIGLGTAAVGTGAVLGAKQLKKNKENK